MRRRRVVEEAIDVVAGKVGGIREDGGGFLCCRHL